MKDILHIARDAIFIDYAYHIFEEIVPGRSEYISFSKRKKLEHIKATPIKVYNRFVVYHQKKLNKILESYNIFIFHSLAPRDLYILRSLPEDAKVVWFAWGYDYYDLIDKDYLKSLSLQSQYFDSKTFFQKTKTHIARKLFPPLSKKSIINRIDFVSIFYKDYLLLRKSLPDFRAEHIQWYYGSLEDYISNDFDGLQVSGRNILLGNSSSITNNHLDALELLKSVDLGDRTIITPLSYGDSRYRDIVIDRGKSMFHDKFVPVVDFIPIDDYIRLISTCSIVVMNHLRAQAYGNVLIMLYFGAKVFLDPENPIYEFFREQGALIYTLEELGVEINSRLSQDQIEMNRSILRKNWSREVILKKAKELISNLES